MLVQCLSKCMICNTEYFNVFNYYMNTYYKNGYSLFQSRNMSQVQDMVPQERKSIDVCLSVFYLHLHEEEMIQVQMQLVPIRKF